MRRALLTAVAVPALVIGASAPALADSSSQSNMGLCSSFLAQLPPPPGESNVRALVNHLILAGGFEIDTPGQLYSVRAKQHENAPAPQECVQR